MPALTPPVFDEAATRTPLFDALTNAARQYGLRKPILEDQARQPMTYLELIRAAFALGRRIAAVTTSGERVGVLLPASSAAVITFFALHAFGRVPAMLNFTSGIRNLRAACDLAGVKRVLTSHRFVEQGKFHDLVDALESRAAITYLEDLRREVGVVDKAFAAIAAAAPKLFRHPARPSDPGVVLFTSGSFGAPRGVVLTQANLVANCRQIASHIALDPDWVMFNPLPTFHCFGLTGGVLLPLFTGMKAFEYPSPLHTRQIPPLVAEVGASILLATDTFVNQYARASDHGELGSLKFIVCGAEKVREETHAIVAEKFGPVPVLEGYGATETSPVLAVNKPDDNRHGTVGGLLPGIEYRIDEVPGIARGGKLMVRGANVMAGYLTETGSLEAPEGGWHDTGDVVEVSDDRWVRILGRVKRFAKIGGEMVSLSAAEDLASSLWPSARHAVVAVPDARKGERLILVTDRRDAKVEALVAYAQGLGAPELAAPRKIICVTEIPALGTGKTDYVAVQRIVEAELRRAA